MKKFLSPLAIVALVVSFMFPIRVTYAANLTSLKDVMSTIADSASANHTISFVAPSGVANNTSLTLTFPSGFDLSSIVEDDVDIAGSTEGELTTAANCAAAEKASVTVAAQVITITLCSGDGGDFTNSETITVEIGTNATASGTGSNQIVNQTAVQNNTDPKIVVATASDSGSLAVEIIADDSVSVTATVDPSVTFSISDVAVGFGVLDAAQECWAEGTPPASCNSTKQIAHTLTAGTNATGGLVVTYNGATLTSGSNSIDVATITGDADGDPGTEQFAIGVDDNGATFTIVSAYDENSNNYKFVAGATTQLFSSAGPVTSTAVDTHYIANISASTEAGSYSTSITYIATGTF